MMPEFSGKSATWFAALLLLLVYFLTVASMVQKSPTMDEQGFITRGVGYVSGENRHMRVGHPAGLNIWNGWLVAKDPTLRLPVEDPSWNLPSFHRPSELFMWEMGNDVERIMLLARLPTIWLGMLLVALAGRWASMLWRSRWSGLMAMVFLGLDPNLLAHTRLATTDAGLAAGALAAAFSLWWYFKKPGWDRIIVAGLGFALLQNTKFTSGLYVPILGLVILIGIIGKWRQDRQFPGGMFWQLFLGFPIAAFLALWAMYGFEIGTLPASLPAFPQLGGMTVPLAHHLEQLLDIGGRLQKQTPAFLNGAYSDNGWWHYFPTAFLLKTPIPTLLMLAVAALLMALRQGKRRLSMMDAVALLLPPLGYFAFSLTTDINIGYRHLLPLLPFLAIFVGAVPVSRGNRPRIRLVRYAPVLLGIWLALNTISVFPDFIPFFNRLAGGPEEGWRYLVDSNIDWGQDLKALAEWQEATEVGTIWLSYFGEARPDYYGIDYRGLPSFPPRLSNPLASPYYPDDPAPGVYAISATNLQGVLFEDHELFASFRNRERVAKIGYSIFIYEVPARGEPADLYLGGLQVEEMQGKDYAMLGTNDVTLHWFDSTKAWLLPGDGREAYLAVERQLTGESLTDFTFVELARNEAYLLYSVQRDSSVTGSVQPMTLDGSLIDFLGASDLPASLSAGDSFTQTTNWQQRSYPVPVRIFVHVRTADEPPVAQWDGLGAVSDGWRQGDILQQMHQITLPADLQSGSYEVVAGLYNPETGLRYRVETGADHMILGSIIVP